MSTLNVEQDLGIGQMEMTLKAEDLAHSLPIGALFFGLYQYCRDSQQVGIKVPVSGRANLYLYAFKSHKEPSKLRLYFAQLYPAFPYTDSTFYGEIRWLNLQDYTLNWAQYKNGKVVSGHPFGRLDFLQKQYDQYHEGRPPVPQNYPLNDTTIESCLMCEAFGLSRIETEKGFRRCLFEMPLQKEKKENLAYGFPGGAFQQEVLPVMPSGFMWKTPFPWEWRVLKDDMGVNASRFLRTEGRNFYPPIADF